MIKWEALPVCLEHTVSSAYWLFLGAERKKLKNATEGLLQESGHSSELWMITRKFGWLSKCWALFSGSHIVVNLVILDPKAGCRCYVNWEAWAILAERRWDWLPSTIHTRGMGISYILPITESKPVSPLK